MHVRSVWTEECAGYAAVKASDIGSAQGHTREAANRGSLSIHVEDWGVGLSPEQLANLFRPGAQCSANNLQAGGGSGFGLYISKGIVEEHKGHLNAVSNGLGKGSTFTTTLPVFYVPSLTEASMDVTIAANGMGTTAPASLRILLVDDVASNRKSLSRLLEK